MNCTQTDALIQLGLDGRLSPAERVRLDAHLIRCAACRAAWDEYRRLAVMSSAWTRPAAAPENSDGVFMDQVLAQIAAGQISPPRPIWQGFALAVSALTALSFWAGPGLSHLFPTLLLTVLPSPHALFSPDDLRQTLGRAPQDAFGAWDALTRHSVALPGWVWSALAVTLGVNLLFVRRARQSTQETAA